MSSNLYWKPIVPNEGECLSKALKFAISRKVWDTDGSCGDGEHILTPDDVPFLEGMVAAGSAEIQKDCRTLIEAIKKHGAIALWHQF